MSGLEPLLLLQAAGTVVSAAGTIASGQSANRIGQMERDRLVAQGIATKQASDYEAAQLDIQANDEFASAQREAQQQGRQKRLALSRLQAVGAAGGFTATDPSSLALADEIEKYGTLQEQMSMYGGESRRSGLRAAAEGRRFSGDSALASAYASGDIAAAEGRSKRDASYMSAAGTIISSGSSMYEKYAKSKPVTSGLRYG
jgi:hypothetical protein